MGKHDDLTPEERQDLDALNALPVAAPDVPEGEHFYRCETCGQAVDMRRLGDVLYHEDDDHEPLVPSQPKRLSFIEPLSPVLVEVPPAGDGWAHEIKYDGYRTQLHVFEGGGQAFTRNGHDWSDKYARLISAALQLPCESAILEGEVVVQKPDGRCDFKAVRNAITSARETLVFMAFDLLELDGEDLRKQKLEGRRDLLAKLIGPNDPKSPIQFSAHVVGNGDAFFQAVDAMGLEGIVSKRLGSRYRSGRSDLWLKTKCFTEEVLTVVGTETGGGAPVALLAREEDGKLVYAGGAMVTLAATERDRFWKAVERLALPTPAIKMESRKGAKWVRPEICVRVRTLRGEEKLRHATIMGIAAIEQARR